MATTTAKTKKDVDEMSAKGRLYDSLSYSYGKKGEQIEKNYNQSISQVDRGLLQRGMQRSSYGAQTIANMYQQKNEALNDNQSALIADYENRLADYEQRDLDEAYRQAQLEISRGQLGLQEKQLQQSAEQFNITNAYNYAALDQNKDLAEAQMAQNQNQFEATNKYNYAALAQNKDISDAQLAQSAYQFGETNKYNYAALAQNKAISDAQLAQNADQFAQNLNLSYAQLAQNKEISQAQLAQQKELTMAELAQSKELTMAQIQQGADQFEKEFGLKAQSWDQEYAMGVASVAAQNSNDVSDALLQMAGISRQDYNAMKAQTASTSVGGYDGYNPGTQSHDDYVDKSGNIYTWDAGSGKYVLKPKSKATDDSFNGDLFGLNTNGNPGKYHEASNVGSNISALLNSKKNKG